MCISTAWRAREEVSVERNAFTQILIKLCVRQWREGEVVYILSTWEGALIEVAACHCRVLETLFYRF